MGLRSELGQNKNKQGSTALQGNSFLRFWDRFIRDGWNWYFAGFLVIVSAIPYVAGLIVSVNSLSILPMLITAPIGGMVAAPQLCGLADTILRSLRDEDQSSWWKTYRKSWKRNWKTTLLPGAIFGSISSVQFFTLYYSITVEPDFAMIAWVALSVVITTAILTFFLALIAAVEGRLPVLIRNCVILCFRQPIRTLGSLLVQLTYWGLICWFFPKSLPVFIIFQFWLPTSIATALIYPPLEEAYDLEAQILELHDQEMEG